MSGQFAVVNGVKQGGVLSPLLFAVYLDGFVISASDNRYQDLSDEAGRLEVLRKRMPKLKSVKGSVFN